MAVVEILPTPWNLGSATDDAGLNNVLAKQKLVQKHSKLETDQHRSAVKHNVKVLEVQAELNKLKREKCKIEHQKKKLERKGSSVSSSSSSWSLSSSSSFNSQSSSSSGRRKDTSSVLATLEYRTEQERTKNLQRRFSAQVSLPNRETMIQMRAA